MFDAALRTDIKNLHRQARSKPLETIEACRDGFKELDLGYKKALYAWIGVVCASIYSMEENPDQRRQFLSKDTWPELSYAPKRKNLVRLAFMYALSVREAHGPSYDRACSYTKAVSRFLAENVDARDIPGLIEEAGGIERLLEASRLPNSSDDDDERESELDDTEPGRSTAEGDDDEEERFEPDEFDDPMLPSKRHRTTERARHCFNPEKELIVEMEQSALLRLLHCRDGDKVEITAEFKSDESTWRRLMAINSRVIYRD